MIKKLFLLLIASLSFSAVTPNTTTVYSLLVSKNAQINGYLKSNGITNNGTISSNYFVGNGSSLTNIPTVNRSITANFATTSNYAITANWAINSTQYLTTANADLRYHPLTTVLFTTTNADVRYISLNYTGNVTINGILKATANYAASANYAITANYALNIPPQPNYLTTSNAYTFFVTITNSAYVTSNYSGSVSISQTISANTLFGNHKGDGSSLTGIISGIITANADLRYYPISGVIGITTVNADARYLTSNYSSGASFNGNVSANFFIGNGSLLSGITGGSGLTTANADLRYVSFNYTGNVSINGYISANTLYGDGSNLRNLPGAPTGLVTNNYWGGVSVNGNISANFYIGNGSLLSGITGGGGGITTANADTRYVSNNQTNPVSINAGISVNSLFIAGSVGVGGKVNPQETLDVLGSFAVEKQGGGVDTFFVSTNGRVGIGTEQPSNTLEVNGTISCNTFYGSGAGITGISASPAGSNQMVQFNDNGITSGNTGFQWINSTNTLVLNNSNPGIQFTGITVEPNIPDTGNIRLYGKSVGGRMMMKQKAPSGVDTSLQPFLGTNTVYLWTPNTATTGVGTGFGTVWPTNTGTITHPTVTNTNFMTTVKFMQHTNAATTRLQPLGLLASTATLANVFRGDFPGRGGFYMYSRVAFPLVTRVGGGITFYNGLTSMTTAMVAVTLDASLTGDFCGFYQGVSDNANTMSFISRDNATTSKRTITLPGVGIAANTLYDFTVYSAPNGGQINYRMVEVSSNIVITDNFTTTNLPRNTIFMGAQVQMSNGTGNVTVTTEAMGLNKMYLECDN